jgi:hypothetical protein
MISSMGTVCVVSERSARGIDEIRHQTRQRQSWERDLRVVTVWLRSGSCARL